MSARARRRPCRCPGRREPTIRLRRRADTRVGPYEVRTGRQRPGYPPGPHPVGPGATHTMVVEGALEGTWSARRGQRHEESMYFLSHPYSTYQFLGPRHLTGAGHIRQHHCRQRGRVRLTWYGLSVVAVRSSIRTIRGPRCVPRGVPRGWEAEQGELAPTRPAPPGGARPDGATGKPRSWIVLQGRVVGSRTYRKTRSIDRFQPR